MTINTVFMNSAEYWSVQKRLKNDVNYNDAIFFIYLRVPGTAYHYEGDCIYWSNITLRK